MVAGVALAPAAGAQTLFDDASLSSLSFESDLGQTRMFPLFDAEVLRYEVAVPSGATEVTVKVATNHSGASVVLESTREGRCCIEELDYDTNSDAYTLELRTDHSTYMTVKVIAEDGSTTREYVVYVDIASSDTLGWRVYNDVPMDRLVDDSRLPSHYVAGVWADDSRVFVTGRRHDPFDQNLFAFNAADSSRQTDDEFVIGGDAGIWSDGITLWSMDFDGSLRAYDLSTGEEDPDQSTGVSPAGYHDNREVDAPRGIWSDGDTLWVVDADNTKVFAFALPEDCSRFDNYCRQSKDFDLSDGNDDPWGITAGSSTLRGDVDTWWVTDIRDRKIYAYNRSDGTRNSALDVDLTQLNISNLQQFYYGLAATDTIMYVAEYITGRVYSFSMPGVSGPVAPTLVSNDASLRSLTLSAHMELSDTALSPTFSSSHTFYTAQVEPDVTSITVTATPNGAPYASAVVKVGGTIFDDGVVALETGTNTIIVEVTAQDGSKQTYTVSVDRRAKSTDATLADLDLTDVTLVDPADLSLVDAFSPETTEYTASVANGVAFTAVSATLSDSAAGFEIQLDGVADADGVINLAAGSNVITVVVTAENGDTRTYTVTVTRERTLSDNAMLEDLELTYGQETVQLVPMFDAPVYSYEAEVAYGVTSLVVKYALLDTNAGNVTVRFGGAKDENDVVADDAVVSNVDNPGTAEDTTTSVGLSVGENTLTVEVTAENGTNKEAYEVSIDRAAASNDATLESLSLDPGTLDRDFYPELLSIDATVGHDDATTKLSIVRSDGDKATVVVKHGSTVERNVDQDGTVTGGTELTALTTDPLNPDALNYTVPLTAPTGTEASETVVSIEVTAEDTTYEGIRGRDYTTGGA